MTHCVRRVALQACAPRPQHRGLNAKLGCTLHLRSAAALQKGHRLLLELRRERSFTIVPIGHLPVSHSLALARRVPLAHQPVLVAERMPVVTSLYLQHDAERSSVRYPGPNILRMRTPPSALAVQASRGDAEETCPTPRTTLKVQGAKPLAVARCCNRCTLVEAFHGGSQAEQEL